MNHAATSQSHRLGGALPGAPVLALCATLLLGGCGGAGGPATAVGPNEGLSHPMVGQKAPEFAAQDPAGPWLPLSSLKDKPVALLFFRPGTPFALDLAREFGHFRDDPSYRPIVFLGIARDSMDRIREFIKTRGISLPILRDPGSISRSYNIGDAATVVLIDMDGLVRFRMDGYFGGQYQARLRATVDALRKLPMLMADKSGSFDVDYAAHPKAPVFSGRAIDGSPFDLSSQKGRVVVLNFFDQDCPHCIKDLPRLVPVLKEFRSRGVVAVGISARDDGKQTRQFLKDHGIDYTVVIDPGRGIFNQYGSTRTPDTFLIDKDGFVRYREHGDRPDRAEVTRLQLRLLLGEDPATLAASLPKDRYAGDGACRACHEREYDDWLLTPHSIAWSSLEKGEKWRDQECVGCHVTARGRPGGFAGPEETPQMVNVQCEVCHGMGGGHPAGAAAASNDPAVMKKVCVTCHTGKFVLNFDPDEALVLMAHQDHPDMDRLFKYSDEQRRRLEAINTRRLEKFKSGVAYIGADACRGCHQEEYDQWSRTAHAGAFAVILRASRGHDPGCTPCHTTGQGHQGGFGDQTKTQANPMTGVQCEVCHGPGDDHLNAPPALKKATIYGITDQCSFCIIQGVCATCHDRKNDPDFDIEKALPLVKHRKATTPARSRAR